MQAVCSDDVEICFFLERMVMVMGFTKNDNDDDCIYDDDNMISDMNDYNK